MIDPMLINQRGQPQKYIFLTDVKHGRTVRKEAEPRALRKGTPVLMVQWLGHAKHHEHLLLVLLLSPNSRLKAFPTRHRFFLQ